MPKYGNKITMEVYGESHGECVGVVISGLPLGLKINLSSLQAHTDRRKASYSSYSTSRIEPDKIVVKDGISENGTVEKDRIELIVYNTAYRKNDYSNLTFTPRPSHADYPAMVKYGDKVSLSGGGKYSGRLTLPICIAGGIAEQILKKKGIFVCSYLSEVAGIKGSSYKDKIPTLQQLKTAKLNPFHFFDNNLEILEKRFEEARLNRDSLGGIVETVIYGLPVGVGDSLFDGVESAISNAVFAIPAVKGVEFGIGFDFATLTGSKANDCYYYDNGSVKTYTNNNGGIVGGMTNGMPITLRTVVKPTPSIGIEQKTVNLLSKTNTTITINGRHDVCIAPRAVAPIESAVAFALLDIIMQGDTNE